jgi:transcription elongation factor Elf1
MLNTSHCLRSVGDSALKPSSCAKCGAKTSSPTVLCKILKDLGVRSCGICGRQSGTGAG